MQHLILLHGALGHANQLHPLADLLKTYHVHTLNFSGHGGTPMSNASFSIPLFAEEVRQYIRQNNLGNVAIFGYSMGGYVAMYLGGDPGH
jgi:pimeloyl-ACP methyl ester carboxylesterase